jgi:3-dehydroquinate synthase/2-deoxy-scyllo-inosose synthase
MTTVYTRSPSLSQDWDIRWNNPDPPYQRYRFPYHLRRGAWEELVERVRALNADRLLVVTDTGFPGDVADVVLNRFARVQAHTSLHVLPGGEQGKNLRWIDELARAAINEHDTRASVVVAIGGGLVGNMAGLLAGLLWRGVRLVHLPTTLLAMSDSCLSLKQAVNVELGGTELGKNHIGLFHAPVLVWSDLAFLDHLPAREVRAALCETAKNVVAICPDRFPAMMGRLRPDAEYSDEDLAWFIDLSIAAKCSVMAHDALEKREAVVLEYGHTIGHALEAHTHGTIPHGFAIGIGLAVEARISQALGWLSQADLEAHLALLRSNGAPTAIPSGITAEDLLPLLLKDNKRGYLPARADAVDMVLLERLGVPHRTGQTVLTQVDASVVREAIDWSRAQEDPYALESSSPPRSSVQTR